MSTAETTKPTTPPDTRPLKKFRLLTGAHAIKLPNGLPHLHDAKEDNNNIVITRSDLVAKFGKQKFEFQGLATEAEAAAQILTSTTPEQQKVKTPDPNKLPVPTRKDLEAMSLTDLREFANEEEIDISTSSKKDEIINVILATIGTR